MPKNTSELERDIEHLRRGQDCLQEQIDKINEVAIDNMKQKFYDLSAKWSVATGLWGLNALLMVFLIYKVFELAGKVGKL